MRASRSSISYILVVAALGLGASGCFGHFTPATATMGDLEAPVLLGPVDRVGGGAPLKTEAVSEFEGTATHAFSQSSSGNTTYTTDIAETDLAQEAEYATRKSKDLDIRLTEVKPQAVGVLVTMKARVDVEGDVVRVKKTSGGKK